MSVFAPDWSRYLESVCEDYAHWWEKYTLTDVTGRQQQAAASEGGGFLLDLMAESVPEKTGPEGDAGGPQNHEQAEKMERFTVLEGLRKYAKEHVLLQGAPGSGKSTVMARLLLEEAQQARTEQLKIPVLVELRYYDQSLQQLIEDSLLRRDPLLDVSDLEQWLNQGRLLLLLDGVNELPLTGAWQDVQRFRRRYEKTTSMVFTTRKLSEGGDLGIEKKLTMQPLSETQMRDFVQAYLPGQGKAMLAQLGDRLREFGSVPLLLWMLCSVYASNQQQIPANLGEFFRRFTRLYDEKLKQDVQAESQSKRLWSEVLQELAFEMMVGRGKKEASVAIPRAEAVEIVRRFCQKEGEPESLSQAKLWLEDLMKYHLIQLGTVDSIQFRHQLIQEYYAAERLLRQLPELSSEELKWKYLNYLKWTEPLLLMAALVSEKDNALRLVQLGLEVDYELGAKLAGAISEKWQPQAVKLISDISIAQKLKIHLWSATRSSVAVPILSEVLQDQDKHVRGRVVDALGYICNASAIPALLSAFHDESSIVRSRAAQASGYVGDTSAVSALLGLLHDENVVVRGSAANALGGIGDTSAVSGLLSILQDDSSTVRNSAVDALSKIGDTSAVLELRNALQNKHDAKARSGAAKALHKIGDTSAIPELLSALHDDDEYVRRNAKDAIVEISNSSTIPILLNALQENSSSTRMVAANALGRIGDASAVPGLINILHDKHPLVRNDAANALGKIGDASAVPELLNILHDNHRFVRRSAVNALGKIGVPSAIPGLLNTLYDEDLFVRIDAENALVAGIGGTSAVPELLNALKTLHDGDWTVRDSVLNTLYRIDKGSAVSGLLDTLQDDEAARFSAVNLLGKVGDTSAVPGLLVALQDNDWNIRRSAARALGKIGDVSAVPELLNALQDEDLEVRRISATALGTIGNAAAVPTLLNALQDDDDSMRRISATALGTIGNAAAVPELLNTLQDDDWSVRVSVANALGKMTSETSIDRLLDTLQDEDLEVRCSAANALGQIGNVLAVPGLLNAIYDENERVRYSAVKALGHIGDASAVPELLNAVHDENEHVRRHAIYELCKMNNALAPPILLNILHHGDTYIKKVAASMLSEIRDVSAVPDLLEALHDDDKYVRKIAAERLGEIGDASAVPELLHAIRDRDTYVRDSVADALVKVGNTSVIFGLLNALYDDDTSTAHWLSNPFSGYISYVRKTAADALGRIDDASVVNGLLEALENQSTDTLDIFSALKQVQERLGYYRPCPSTLKIMAREMKTREVFISYAWGGESATIADQLDQAFQSQGINIICDKKDAGYKANIRDFMQQIGQGNCVLVVISDKYLKSENCMFELVEIANNGDFYDRIFPIVLSDANIYDAIGRLDYLDYWDNKKKTLQERMRNSSDFAKRGSINDVLDQYAVIRDNIDQLADTLKNMNTLTPDMHRDSNFDVVIEAVKAKLAE